MTDNTVTNEPPRARVSALALIGAAIVLYLLSMGIFAVLGDGFIHPGIWAVGHVMIWMLAAVSLFVIVFTRLSGETVAGLTLVGVVFLAFATAVATWGGSILAGFSEETTVTTASADDTTTTTEVIETTTTTIEASTDPVSGNLFVDVVADWDPVLNAGDLVLDSAMCTFFASESEALAWLAAVQEEAGDVNAAEFIAFFNERYDELRARYWSDFPTAAANMMVTISDEKPGLPVLVDTVYGFGAWDDQNPSATMSLVEKLTWTTAVMRPASFRTTGCDNSVGPDDDGFRSVYRAGNVTISPDDDNWEWTLVDVVMPSHVNAILADIGSDLHIRQIMVDGGGTAYEVVRNDRVVRTIAVERKVSVPAIVYDEAQNLVMVEIVFSTLCGNLALPEFKPPRKVESTTTTVGDTTTTTVRETTTTTLGTTTTTVVTTTTTTRPTTTTTTKPTTTTTTVVTTTTTTKPTTTTTTVVTTTTTTKPTTTTTTKPTTTTTTKPTTTTTSSTTTTTAPTTTTTEPKGPAPCDNPFDPACDD